MVSVYRQSFRAACLVLGVALTSCSAEPKAATQLILVADTDVDLVRTVEFEISAPGAETKTARATRPADGQPVYLTLLRDQGPLGPLTITARGLFGTSPIVTRTHEVSFVEEQTLVVPLHLARVCVNRECPGQTCNELGCTPHELDEESLAPWSGRPPELGDESMLVQCGSAGMVDVTRDPRHCGGCDMACSSSGQNTEASCVNSSCAMACEPLWGDCDDNPRNGCELRLTEPEACGACGERCGANERCDTGACLKK